MTRTNEKGGAQAGVSTFHTAKPCLTQAYTDVRTSWPRLLVAVPAAQTRPFRFHSLPTRVGEVFTPVDRYDRPCSISPYLVSEPGEHYR